MNIEIKQQKFVLNGEDVFLYGGEFHYFRTPIHEWEDRIVLMKKAGLNLISTYVPWRFHEPEEGKIDLTGTTEPETNLGHFLELIHKHDLYCIVRPGPYVMAEVKYEGIPDWLINRYPDILALDIAGNPHPTRVISYLHPLYLEKVEQWYEAVCRIIAPQQISASGTSGRISGGSVIMFQLDNEVAMLHWVVQSADFHPDRMAQFTQYIEQQSRQHRSQNMDDAHDLHAHDFTDREQLKSSLMQKPDLFQAWYAFHRDTNKQYIERLRSYAKQFGIDVPFIVNVHGFKDFSVYSRGTDYPIGLSQLVDVRTMDDVVLAGDFYPGHIGYDTFHDLVLSSVFTHSIQPEHQPLFSAEFQSGRLSDRPRVYPQDLDLNTRTCLASGMNALNYYMFCGGENRPGFGWFGRSHEWQAPIDSQGNVRPSYHTAKHLGTLLKSFGTEMLNAERIVDTYIGFQPDYYTFGQWEGEAKAMWDTIQHEREAYAFDGIYRMLIAANYSVSAWNMSDERDIDPNRIPSLWVHATDYMREDIQKRLLRYIEAGGRLIVFPTLPQKNMIGELCTLLADGIGVKPMESVEGMHTVDVLAFPEVFVNRYVTFDAREASAGRVIASKDGKPAGVIKTVGEGTVMVLGLGMGHQYNYQLDLIRFLAAQLDISQHIRLSQNGLTAVEKRSAQGSFLFVNNYDELDHTVSMTIDGEDGDLDIHVPQRSGVVLLKDFVIHPGWKIKGSSLEITAMDQSPEHIKFTVYFQSNQGKMILEKDGKMQDFQSVLENNEAVCAILCKENHIEIDLAGTSGSVSEIVFFGTVKHVFS